VKANVNQLQLYLSHIASLNVQRRTLVQDEISSRSTFIKENRFLHKCLIFKGRVPLSCQKLKMEDLVGVVYPIVSEQP